MRIEVTANEKELLLIPGLENLTFIELERDIKIIAEYFSARFGFKLSVNKYEWVAGNTWAFELTGNERYEKQQLHIQ